MILTFGLLTAAILALWFQPAAVSVSVHRAAWFGSFGAACVAAMVSGILEFPGLLWTTLFIAAVLLFAPSAPATSRRVLAAIFVLLLAAGLMAHALPGFRNPLAIPPVRLTPDALPYRLHLNFDKTVVGLFLLGLLHRRIATTRDWRAMFAAMLPVAALTVAVLLFIALFAGYVRLDPKFPPQAPLFLWANLCLTCVAEEALFRGFVQAQLAQRWQNRRHGAWLALAIAALLFGLAHFAGGPIYVGLSTLAGLGYGWSYLRSGGRIEASILTHFTVNALHFLGFTYPALARV